jgi:hypothetical protein
VTELEVDLSGSTSEWVGALPRYQQTTVNAMLASADQEAVTLSWLESAGVEHTAPLGAMRTGARLFYDKLLEELHSFLCTSDSYDSERRQILRQAQAGKATLIAGITAAIAPHVGASAALIGPPVAITLAMVGRASRAATCEALGQFIQERQMLQATDEGGEDGAPAPPAGAPPAEPAP